MTGRIGYHEVDYDKPETLPIGYLFGIAVWRDNIGEAYGEAVGPLPAAPALLPPGEMKATYAQVQTGLLTTAMIPTSWTYDPGPADYDKNLVDEYVAAVQAWNDRAAVAKNALDIILAHPQHG